MNARVLIVDDTEDNRLVLMDVLDNEGYALSEAVDGVDVLEQIEREPPDLVLLDIMMPRLDGIECCRRLQADERTRGIPVILVTALDDDRHVVKGLDAGAVDYVGKPFTPAVVRARVRAALRAKIAIDELRAKNEEVQRLAAMLETSNGELQSLALHDGLTGLPNRLLLMDRLAQAIERGRRDPELRFALLFLDFDRFKQVNDTLGHAAGDELLRSIAGRLRHELRGSDTVVGPGVDALPTRLGGDEFVAIIEAYDHPHDLERIVARLREALQCPHTIHGHQIVSTASIGIATSDRRYDRAEEMLRDADAAMYRAKQARRGSHVYFDEQMHREIQDRCKLERQLLAAVETGTLPVLYEPIVRLDDARLHAVQAVIDWPRPGGDRLGFDALVALATESGVLLPLSRHLLMAACGRLASWSDGPAARRLRLWIETREEQLGAIGFVELVGETLASTGLEPSRLILQVPERTLRHDADRLRSVLAALRGLGVQLAIDGSERGHFALAPPAEIEIGSMRIDREVTRPLGNRHHAAVVHAVITLAHNLGIRVVAGDIRDRPQLAQLQSLDCDLGQGPLFGGPFTSSRCERLAAADRMELELI